MSDPAIPVPVDAAAAVGGPSRFAAEVEVDSDVLARIASVCEEVDASDEARCEAGRDWWPLSMVWALGGQIPAIPAAVARPKDATQVAAVLSICADAGVPVTPFAGRSGVCGGSVPARGGISLELTALDGIVDVDDVSLQVEVRAGTFGDRFESLLQTEHSLTLGHWPQSIAISTVGGWIACRGAGQYSTRYGKIEDMVVGLEVALADGRIVRTGGASPRTAAGPDLTQLFVGSEGTLGVITKARLRARPLPAVERRAVFAYPSFDAGLDACRRILRRGATPAVLRLFDTSEAARTLSVDDACALVVMDEGDPVMVDATMAVVGEECGPADRLDEALAGRWFDHRNTLPPIESLVRAGIVADTIEIAAPWRELPAVYHRAIEGLQAIDTTIAASAHQSHAYVDGACLYFTFAGRPGTDGDPVAAETYYRAAWDAVMSATEAGGGALSHHHGIGINRSRYMARFLGEAMGVLAAVKDSLDPRGVLNPGKLGLGTAVHQ